MKSVRVRSYSGPHFQAFGPNTNTFYAKKAIIEGREGEMVRGQKYFYLKIYTNVSLFFKIDFCVSVLTTPLLFGNM